MIHDPTTIPPFNDEAEKTVLAGLCLDQVPVPAVCEVLPPEEPDWFFMPANALLYRLLVEMHAAGLPFGLVSVEDELMKRGQLEKIGGREYLIELGQTYTHAAEAEHCATIVKRLAMLRRLMTSAEWMHREATAPGADPQAIAEGAEQQLRAVSLATDTSLARKPGPEDVASIMETMSRQPGEVCGLDTGLADLDRATGGLKAGNMIVIAARPSMGKTSLGAHIAQHQAVNRSVPVGFFSLEMTRGEILEAIASMRSGVNLRPEDGQPRTDEERERMREQAELLADAPLYIDDSEALKIRELRARGRKMRDLYGVQIIFVDYLQRVAGPRSENRQTEMAAVSMGLKTMAKELCVPVVCMAQLNRAVEGREGNRPRLSDLRETGQIEQDADAVLLLHRPAYYGAKDAEYLAELNIAKQRRGPTGTIRLHFDRRTTSFHNWHKIPGDAPPPARKQEDFEPW